jgi:hypothetical protein
VDTVKIQAGIARFLGPRKTAPSEVTVVPFDGSRLLTVYLALLIFIPSTQVIGPLGAAGSPATIFGVVLFARWLVARAQRTTPVGWTMLSAAFAIFAVAVVASELAGNLRPLTGLEVNSLDRGLIRLMSWGGVFLVSIDGLPTRDALRRVMTMAGAGGVFIALLGLIQSTTGFNLVTYMKVPGLSELTTDTLAGPELRNGLARVFATTIHPIEYSTVLVLLIAITAPLAMTGLSGGHYRRWLIALAIMGLAFPLAVARSGFLAAAALAIVVIPRLPPRPRRRVLLALPVGLLAIHTSFPGLLGTVRDLFQYTAKGDEHARTDDYPVVEALFWERPLLGRGFGTYLPSLYRTLDNQYLLTLVDAGLVGLGAYIFLHVAAIRTGQCTRRAARSVDDRLTCQCLIGAAAASLASSITFDSLSFPMFAGLFFLSLGLSGGLATIIKAESTTIDSRQLRLTRRPPILNLRTRVAVGLIWMIFAALGLHVIRSNPVTWISSGSALVSPAIQPAFAQNRLSQSSDTSGVAKLVWRDINSDNVRAKLRAQGYRAQYSITLGSGSLMFGTDQVGDGPLIQAQAQSTDPGEAEATLKAVMREVSREVSLLQTDAGISSSVQAVLTGESISSNPAPEKSGGRRAYAMLLILVLALWRATIMFVEQVVKRRSPPAPTNTAHTFQERVVV